MRPVRPGRGRILTDRNNKTSDEVESRRILDRVAREADPGGLSLIGTVAGAARKRFGQDMPADADPVDYWGTKIGRFLGLLITIVLIVWLLLFLIGGI
jgi:hypothetical protein